MSVSKPQTATEAALGSELLPWAAAALCAVLLWSNFDKGAWWGVQGWGRPYWWLDYSHGFVRRGLVGQLFQMLFGRLDEAHLAVRVAIIHRVLCFGLAALVLFVFVRAMQAQQSRARLATVGAIGVWLVAGEVWPTLAYNQGYLDVIVIAMAVVAALCVRRRWYAAAAAVALVGPFVHEYFIFLTPFVMSADRSFGAPVAADAEREAIQAFDAAPEERMPFERGVLIVGGAALLATVATTFAVSMSASGAEIAAMPLSADDKKTLVATTMMQSLASSFKGSAGLLFGNVGFDVLNFPLFLLPAMVAAAGMIFWRRWPAPIGRWIRVVAAFAPLAALLVAWDFSRLTVNAGLTAGLLFLMSAEDDPASPGRGSSIATLAGAAALALAGGVYLMLPFAYVYYPTGPADVFPLKTWPVNGRTTLGLNRLWPNAVIHPYRAARYMNVMSLQPAQPAVLNAKAAWRVPAGVSGALVFGPYAEVGGGRRQARLHLTLVGSPQQCLEDRQRLSFSSAAAGRAGSRALAPSQPMQAIPDPNQPCALTLVGAPFVAPLFGERDVETPVSVVGPTPLPMVLDGYALTAAAPDHSR